MRVILVDPFARTVTEAVHDGSLQGIYKLTECDCITSVGFGVRHAFFLDDEGLYREGQAFFKLQGYGQPLAGKAILVGIDDEGNDVDCTYEVDAIRPMITFPMLAFAGMAPTTITKVQHPIFGEVQQISSRARFIDLDEEAK